MLIGKNALQADRIGSTIKRAVQQNLALGESFVGLSTLGVCAYRTGKYESGLRHVPRWNAVLIGLDRCDYTCGLIYYQTFKGHLFNGFTLH